ncbi:Protein phosphatase PP2A regulatory subunit A [Komagataella phaffii CBS 7435]|uniref:Regulatory subunit A of the heterotrimeric protein phosphatase 2A n=2 Tax=Komagataella phaffii TaxID=460519 RepID=C4R824_KOMPG|nr:Regulatory subunit A of the heterotrimeric protein phosphatase 2A [Komagataella phaffii GS115]AOA64512.1 GQ67_04859T0 [Komagataella phaffii]CAH2450860.1 Protein phosphatase PP2A regulatory subunit A [Komagataella phaffii CBS 7435]AOA69467.1 GQ68_04831T0 [Komagataella phaffii GS115]CAY71749.1 Regulatory subunit A of the heterotrimeric protein phosphatase 2A [Komagataella phaffii GS115]CCA40649.1 Protein phosphatase PP2A regulatory subunit A [Komagataella phaffii CBS 7435]
MEENHISFSTPKSNMAENNQDLYPIALLMDELRYDDVASRVQAMKRLDTIAIALGPERTRSELLQYLDEVVTDDEDEVICIIAEELGKFVPLIGGPQYAVLLLPILEKISSVEEPVVRDKAVESLNLIGETLSDAQIDSEFVPLVEKLAKDQWFSSCVASTGLFKGIVARVDSEKRKNLLNLYFSLIKHEIPLVRKSSATHLPEIVDQLSDKFANVDNDEFNWNIIYEMFQVLIVDHQDSVKFLSVEVLICMLEFLHKIGNKTHHEALLQNVLNLINDPSWRVKYMIANRFEKLVEAFHDDQISLSLIGEFAGLMKDHEPEVRKAISEQLPGYVRLVSETGNHGLQPDANKDIIIKEIIPCVNSLSEDESEVVRAALASQITGLAPYLGNEATIEHLLPIFLHMLNDVFSEVRLNIISNLQVVNEVIGIERLSNSLLPAITSLAQDKQWRVRLAIIEQIPLLAEQLGVSFFDEGLGQLCMGWLDDPVYSIREAAVNNLQKLTQIFGEEWARKDLILRILERQDDLINFIHRITSLFAFMKLIPVVRNEIIKTDIYPFFERLIKDEVPNIRFNVAKAYQVIGETLLANDPKEAPVIESTIIPQLVQLTNDEDVDVRFFATKSLEGVKKALSNYVN